MPPRLARLLALVAALALVAGAFAVRGLLADDDGEATTATGGGGEPGGGELRVLCDADLGEATCAALGDRDGVMVSAPTSAEDAAVLLSQPEPGYDAWLTVDPWPEVLDVGRLAAGLPAVTGEPVPVASAPLAVLADPEDSPCPVATATWECLTEPSRPPVGLPDLDTAVGGLVVGHAAVGLVGDDDFGIGAVRDDAEVRDPLAAVVDAVRATERVPTADQVGALVQPGRLAAAVTLSGLAEAVAASNQGARRGLVVADLAPAAELGVVLAPVGDRAEEVLDALGRDDLGETVREALSGAGWDGPPGPTRGLPAPDVLYALLEEIR